jgi:phosphopentomutase
MTAKKGRFTILVLDSVGIGALPDAKEFNDEGVNTLLHVKEAMGELKIPNLVRMGLYNIDGLGLTGVEKPTACFGRYIEKVKAKDTIAGHFEIAGLDIKEPFKIFIDGFPDRILSEFEKRIGTKTIGNYWSSGTEIIKVLGDEHVKTGYPIVYVSADSLMQIAMHEEVIPLERQYEICKIARELLMGDDTVARIICRPFLGKSGGYYRTENRRDFAIDPPGKTILNVLQENGKDVIAVGKIEDIFNRSGITIIDHSKNNSEGIEATVKFLSQDFDGLMFINLVDYDMLYGHRKDAIGYGKALEYFDDNLPRILEKLKGDDIFLITADHGTDPTTPGTDHTREYTPLLVYGPGLRQGVNLGTRSSFTDIAATAAEYFEVPFTNGVSFLGQCRE